MVIINYKYPLPINFTGFTCNEYGKYFRKNNMPHRYYGPSVINYFKKKFWNFNGKSFEVDNQKDFIKKINKNWLI